MENRGAKAAAVMGVYAALLVVGGLVAYFMAPPGASAATAIIIPAVCAVVMIVCAALAARLPRSRRAGMIGIHLGLVFALVFAIGIGGRAWTATRGVAGYHRALAEVQAANPGASPEEQAAILRQRGLPDHDKSYLRNMLWGLTGLSLAAFVALLLARPKPADRTPRDEAA